MKRRHEIKRTHLFKAKRINWKELPKELWWVEGALFEGKEGSYILTNIKITDVWKYSEIGADAVGYLVDPETVCEFVAEDEKGNRYFEHDIIKTNEINRAGFDIFVIEYSDGGFCLKNKYYKLSNFLSLILSLNDLEIIGNRFDNEELLGQGQIV